MNTKHIIRVLVAVLLPFFGVGLSAQTTWYVDDDGTAPGTGTQSDPYTSIQYAINQATTVNWDVVLVLPGSYVENIDFLGKAITVKSTQGPAVTTIDGNQTGSVVRFTSGEGSGSVLDGFTITNGGAVAAGGGIYCLVSSPTITNNTITGNTATSAGGMYCGSSSSATITNNTITGNTASNDAGGIYLYNCSPTITNNAITGNTANSQGGGICCYYNCSATITNNIITGNTANFGGGIYSTSSPVITNNTITGNTALNGGGISCDFSSSPAITNTILWNNNAPSNPEIYGNPTVAYSCVKGGWPGTGNHNLDPEFVTSSLGDYYLSQLASGQGTNSPCLDTGDPASSLIVGTTRSDGVPDAGVVDMGYHYAPPSAAATFRTAGSNPASYTATTLPVLGTLYSCTVDLAGTTGHSLAWLVGYTTPLSLTLGGGQTLLVNVADANGELLTQPLHPGPIATYDLPIPTDAALTGFTLSTQAVHIGGVEPFALSNALDLLLGY